MWHVTKNPIICNIPAQSFSRNSYFAMWTEIHVPKISCLAMWMDVTLSVMDGPHIFRIQKIAQGAQSEMVQTDVSTWNNSSTPSLH